MQPLAGSAALLILLSTVSRAAVADSPRLPSRSQGEYLFERNLAVDQATVFVVYRPASSPEKGFFSEVQKITGTKTGLKAIPISTGRESVVQRYDVSTTPIAFVYDRRGRFLERSSDLEKIRAAVERASGVMRIDWAMEGDPRFEEVTKMLGGRRPVPGILRTMSLKPQYLDYINRLSGVAHFSDGYLKRREKELIATYVSALNKCKY